MQLFTDLIIRDLLRHSLKTASVDTGGEWQDSDAGSGSSAEDFIPFLPFSDNAASVLDDVERIHNHPLVPAAIPIYGYMYDVGNGRLLEAPAAVALRNA